MPYTSMKREFEDEIVSVTSSKNTCGPVRDKLYSDSPKYTIKIVFNKKYTKCQK